MEHSPAASIGGILNRPKLPQHITDMDIERAAQHYWRAVSKTPWTDLEPHDRAVVIRYTRHQIAEAWALKLAGVMP